MSQAHIDVLNIAKTALEKREEKYICLALGKLKTKEADQVVQWISDMLFPRISYDGWLSFYHNINADDFPYHFRIDNRIAWINWMIENHEIFDDVKVFNG